MHSGVDTVLTCKVHAYWKEVTEPRRSISGIRMMDHLKSLTFSTFFLLCLVPAGPLSTSVEFVCLGVHLHVLL